MKALSILQPALLVAALTLAAPLAAQQTFTGDTDVVVIEVPVQVTLDGQPVRGLTAENFEVVDGRKTQSLVGFDVVDLTTYRSQKGDSAIPIAARRHFLFLFDLAFSEPRTVVKARNAALDLVRNSLHPTDVAAVGTFTLARGPQLLLGFTSDRWQVEQAITSLGLINQLERGDPLSLMVATLGNNAPQPSASGATGVGADAGLGFESEVLESLRDVGGRMANTDREFETQKVQTFTNTMAELGRLLDTVEGRKHVVLLSEGFSSSLMTGARSRAGTESLNTLEEVRSPGGGGVYGLDSSDSTFGNTRVQNAMERMVDSFRRSDVVVQSVNIRGLQAGGDVRGDKGDGKEGLVSMANGTGGGFYDNFNRLDEAMGQMMEETAVTYLLAFQPKKLKLDGEYHKLKIKLKGGPRGARLSHRAGYYAPKPFSQQTPIEQQLTMANLVISGENRGSIGAEVLATPVRVPGEHAYVPVLVELDGPSLLGATSGEALGINFFVYAVRESDGGFQDYFDHSVGFELAQVRDAVSQTGIKYYGHLDLPPGDYSVRVLARNAQTGEHALRSIPVHVPTDNGEVALLPPLVPEAPGSWLMVREGPEQQQERTVDYPFMLEQQPFIPSACLRVKPKETTQLALLGYNLSGSQVEARVTDADGTPVDGGSFELAGDPTATPQGEQMRATFKAKGLKAGRYQLQVTVTGNGSSATSSLPLEVIGR